LFPAFYVMPQGRSMKKYPALSRVIMLTAACLFCSQCSHASYHRFWRGFIKPALTASGFAAAINRTFIPATIANGAGRGLTAYQPFLTGGEYGLPDEVALVTYSGKTAYAAIGATASGKRYGAMHWDYFDRDRSSSVVARPFTGTAEFEKAYDLLPPYAGWMKNKTTVLVFPRGKTESEAAFLERVSRRMGFCQRHDPADGVFDRVIFVSARYWIEYISAAEFVKGESAMSILMLQPAAGTPVIHAGEGLNTWF